MCRLDRPDEYGHRALTVATKRGAKNMREILPWLEVAAAERAAEAFHAILEEGERAFGRPVVASLTLLEPLNKARARYEREDRRHRQILRALGCNWPR